MAHAGPVGAQRPSHGPLTYEEGSPLQRLSYTPVTESAALTPDGSWSADVLLGFSNIFEQDSTDTHLLFMDMERLVTTLTLRWGVTSRLEVGGRILLETTGGGALDGFILDWHESWGLGQANRDRFPEGRYAQLLRDGDGTTFIDIPRQTLGFEDLRLFARYGLLSSSDGRGLLTARGELRVPGGSNAAARERADVAVTVLARHGVGPWWVHASLGAATVRASPELEPVLQDGSAFFSLALERSFGAFSAVAQYQVQSAVLDSFAHREIDRSASNIVFGASGSMGPRWSWDASFQEDLPSDTPAIDFTLGLRISRTW